MSRRAAYDAAFDGYVDDETGPAMPRLSVATGFHCLRVARFLANPHSLAPCVVPPSGDGERASFTVVSNGRRYRVTVTPEAA